MSAEPVGPAEPTERRTHCATAAGGVADQHAPPAGHRLVGVEEAWRFSRGSGVTVAVIDTGVSPHARLPRLTGGGDYVGDGTGLDDCDLHGTLVAGIIAATPSPDDGFAGVAPEAGILSIRQSSGAYSAHATAAAEGESASVGPGYGPLSTLARAVVRAVDLGAGVVNISEAACAGPQEDLGDEALAHSLAYARDRDVVVVAAAGNMTAAGACRGPDSVASPARFGREILTVGAVDAFSGAGTPFSLPGPWVSVAAPGTDVISVSGGRLIGALEGADGPRVLAGTSYSTAYVSGVAALVRSRFPELSAAEVSERILRTATGGPGRDPTIGVGVVDAVAALADELPPATTLPDPDSATTITAPAPRADDHRPRAVGFIVAGCSALLAAAWAVTRTRPPITARTGRITGDTVGRWRP